MRDLDGAMQVQIGARMNHEEAKMRKNGAMPEQDGSETVDAADQKVRIYQQCLIYPVLLN